MTEWKEYYLNEVYDFTSGLSKAAKDFGFGEGFLGYTDIFHNYFAPNELKSFVNSTKKEQQSCSIKRGDVFLTRTSETDADLGMSCVALRDYPKATFNGFAKRLRSKGNVEILPEFAGFYFRSPRFRAAVSGMSSVTTRASLNNGMLASLKILLPGIDEQKRIANTLGSLHNKISLLRRQNETLEALAEMLFRQWFIVEGDKKWSVGTVDDEFDFVMGQSPLGSTFNEEAEGTIFYQGRTDFGFRFPTPRIYTTAPTRMAKRLDTLISVRAPVGDMNMAFEDCCLGRGVAAFRYKHNTLYYSYTYYKLRSLMDQIKQFEDHGSVFGSIGKDDFKKLENVIPSKHLIERFQREVGPLDEKILLNSTQIKTLTQLRDTLLPKLMSGEVRVETVQKEMALG
jgi:type I restriction enzyme, S subunit